MTNVLAKNQNWAKLAPILGVVTLIFIIIKFQISDLLFWALINIPLYLFHQTEEHFWPGGFKNYVNKTIYSLPDGKENLTDAKIFWINIILVWVAFTIFGILSFFNIGFGLVIIIFSIINCLTHIIESLKRKRWNPGLVVASLQFILSIFAAYYITITMPNFILVWWIGALIFSIIIHLILFKFIIGKRRT
jgi:hypothetical protein